MIVGVSESLIFSPYLRISLGTPQYSGDLEQDFKFFFPKFIFREKFEEGLELV